MTGRQRWTVARTSAVQEFLDGLDGPAQVAVERAIEKLERYGTDARRPLVRHIEGEIWELRIKASNHGHFRVFYFQHDNDTAVAFDAYKKDSATMPAYILERVLSRFEEITGRKP